MPAQIVEPGTATMLTEGVMLGLTLIVSAFEVAVVGDAHPLEEVITQVTTS